MESQRLSLDRHIDRVNLVIKKLDEASIPLLEFEKKDISKLNHAEIKKTIGDIAEFRKKFSEAHQNLKQTISDIKNKEKNYFDTIVQVFGKSYSRIGGALIADKLAKPSYLKEEDWDWFKLKLGELSTAEGRKDYQPLKLDEEIKQKIEGFKKQAEEFIEESLSLEKLSDIHDEVTKSLDKAENDALKGDLASLEKELYNFKGALEKYKTTIGYIVKNFLTFSIYGKRRDKKISRVQKAQVRVKKAKEEINKRDGKNKAFVEEVIEEAEKNLPPMPKR